LEKVVRKKKPAPLGDGEVSRGVGGGIKLLILEKILKQ
jgi:hypothetical protein